jgi:signal recognition particle subunit SRP54
LAIKSTECERIMFNQLSDRLATSLDKLRGIGRLTEDNIKATLGDIRRSLLEADVALPVITTFIEQIQEKALGHKVLKSIRPGETLIKLVQDELTAILGTEHAELNLKAAPPLVILMAGLQGSGKTTTVAKLAHWLKNEKKKSVMVTSTDVYRPGAIEQLATLSQQIDVTCFPSTTNDKPTTITKNAIKAAKQDYADILIIDTAGRLHIDEAMMKEIEKISQVAEPTETLLVVDSMAGQDAANTAKAFNDRLELTGIVLTKTDGDARGGAALSMRILTGKPIKFIGVGEKIDALQVFHPDRIASRILGMGDVVSLVEEAQSKVDEKQADKVARKIKKGKRFDFNDFLDQLKQMKKMGGMKSLLGKLPGMGQMPKAARAMMDDTLLGKMEAIIYSMTLQERRFPAVINGSRKRRICHGSGTTIQDVNKLLKQFTQMQKMLKRFKGKNLPNSLDQLKNQIPPELLGKLGGKLPPNE